MQSLDRLSRELPSRHAQYVATISDTAHAISLELARFILEVASEDHAKRLLDLGSGFSSYVLRAYAAGVPGAVAWSVDDDPAWLEKTRAFLVSEGLSTEHLYNWSEFLTLASTNGPGTFDLVVHDLSTVRSRHGTDPVRCSVLSALAVRSSSTIWTSARTVATCEVSSTLRARSMSTSETRRSTRAIGTAGWLGPRRPLGSRVLYWERMHSSCGPQAAGVVKLYYPLACHTRRSVSARRSPYKCSDRCLFGGSQLL